MLGQKDLFVDGAKVRAKAMSEEEANELRAKREEKKERMEPSKRCANILNVYMSV